MVARFSSVSLCPVRFVPLPLRRPLPRNPKHVRFQRTSRRIEPVRPPPDLQEGLLANVFRPCIPHVLPQKTAHPRTVFAIEQLERLALTPA